MRYSFFFSPLAEKKLIELLLYLVEEWPIKAKEDFRNNLDQKLDQISVYPESCVKSKHFYNLHLCIVTRHTSFLYRIKNNEIEIITVFDNRSSFKSINKEIRKYYGRI